MLDTVEDFRYIHPEEGVIDDLQMWNTVSFGRPLMTFAPRNAPVNEAS